MQDKILSPFEQLPRDLKKLIFDRLDKNVLLELLSTSPKMRQDVKEVMGLTAKERLDFIKQFITYSYFTAAGDPCLDVLNQYTKKKTDYISPVLLYRALTAQLHTLESIVHPDLPLIQAVEGEEEAIQNLEGQVVDSTINARLNRLHQMFPAIIILMVLGLLLHIFTPQSWEALPQNNKLLILFTVSSTIISSVILYIDSGQMRTATNRQWLERIAQSVMRLFTPNTANQVDKRMTYFWATREKIMALAADQIRNKSPGTVLTLADPDLQVDIKTLTVAYARQFT